MAMTTKERRAAAVRLGRCQICMSATRTLRPGLKTCDHCLDTISRCKRRPVFYTCCAAFDYHRFDCKERP